MNESNITATNTKQLLLKFNSSQVPTLEWNKTLTSAWLVSDSVSPRDTR